MRVAHAWVFSVRGMGFGPVTVILPLDTRAVSFAMDSEVKSPFPSTCTVISVGTAFLRFLEIAEKICKCITVITDNDGDIPALEKKYTNYIGNQKKANILISFDCNYYRGDLKIGDTPYNYNTIENLVFLSNGLERMNAILGTTYATEDELRKFMKQNKTECALRIFGTIEQVKFPKYITNVVDEL